MVMVIVISRVTVSMHLVCMFIISAYTDGCKAARDVFCTIILSWNQERFKIHIDREWDREGLEPFLEFQDVVSLLGVLNNLRFVVHAEFHVFLEHMIVRHAVQTVGTNEFLP